MGKKLTKNERHQTVKLREYLKDYFINYLIKFI